MIPLYAFHYAIKYIDFQIKTFGNNLVFDISTTKHRYESKNRCRINLTKTCKFFKTCFMCAIIIEIRSYRYLQINCVFIKKRSDII